MKNREWLKPIGIGAVMLTVLLLTFKFIAWNAWKVEQASDLAERILRAPEAVNLTLYKHKTILYRRSFPVNGEGNYYLDNRFNISGHVDNASFRWEVNGETVGRWSLFRFTGFNILRGEDYTFIFSGPTGDIEAFVKLKAGARFIPGMLSRLVFPPGGGAVIHRVEGGGEIELRYGNGRYSREIPAEFRKGDYYEIRFKYRVSGAAAPVIMLTAGPAAASGIQFRRVLDTSRRGEERAASVYFFRGADGASQQLHLLLRGRRRRGAAVWFRDISFHRYDGDIPFGCYQPSGVSYTNGIDEITDLESRFVDVKYFR